MSRKPDYVNAETKITRRNTKNNEPNSFHFHGAGIYDINDINVSIHSKFTRKLNLQERKISFKRTRAFVKPVEEQNKEDLFFH